MDCGATFASPRHEWHLMTRLATVPRKQNLTMLSWLHARGEQQCHSAIVTTYTLSYFPWIYPGICDERKELDKGRGSRLQHRDGHCASEKDDTVKPLLPRHQTYSVLRTRHRDIQGIRGEVYGVRSTRTEYCPGVSGRVPSAGMLDATVLAFCRSGQACGRCSVAGWER